MLVGLGEVGGGRGFSFRAKFVVVAVLVNALLGTKSGLTGLSSKRSSYDVCTWKSP